MGCRSTSSSSTLRLVVLAVFFLLLTLDRPIVAHARHVRSPSMSTVEYSSREKLLQETKNQEVEHTKNRSTETVHVETPGSTGEAASLGRRGNSPAAASAEKIVVTRYGPRPHPKKHN